MNLSKAIYIASFLLFNVVAYSTYDEAVDGDMSGDPDNPTVVSVVDGSNMICASSTSGDLEYFTITVPEGGTLNEIVLTNLVSQNVGFLAFQAGNTFVTGGGISSLLGWTHLGEFPTDQLAGMMSNGGIGFSIPLPAGDYTFWAQETSTTSSTAFCIDFQMTIPPAPLAEIPTLSQWSLISLSLLMLIFGAVGIRTRMLVLMG